MTRPDFRDGVACGFLMGVGAAIALTGLLLAAGGCFSEDMEALGGSSDGTGSGSGADESGGASMCSTTSGGASSSSSSSDGSTDESTSDDSTSDDSTSGNSTSGTTESSGDESTTAVLPPDLPPPESNCCYEHAGIGCDDSVIEDAVCDSLPQCCAYPWGAACVNQAINTGLCS